MEELLTVAEVAKLLRVHPKSVYRWIYEGKINSCKIGNRIRFERNQITDFVVKKTFSEKT